MTRIKPLKLNGICKNFTFREVAVLAQYINEHEFKKNAVVFKEGDIGDKLFLIVKGEVGIKSKLLSENDQFAMTMIEGDFFGELSLFEAGSRKTTAVALADNTILFSIARKDFDVMCSEEPFVSYKLIREVVGMFSTKLKEGEKELDDLLALKMGEPT